MKLKGQKPAGTGNRKPRRLPDFMHPDEDTGIDLWRQGSFFIWHHRDSTMTIVVDLNGNTNVRHLGPLDEVFAIVDALHTIRVAGEWLYAVESMALDDEDFFRVGTQIMAMMMSTGREDEDVDIDDLYASARESVIDDLLKPPDKK